MKYAYSRPGSIGIFTLYTLCYKDCVTRTGMGQLIALKDTGAPMAVPCCIYGCTFYKLLVSLNCKKKFAIFPSPAGMSLTKLSLGGKN